MTPCSWTIPVVCGTLPPPCAYFTLECIGENKFIMFGGTDSKLGQTNNVYILTMQRQTLVKYVNNCTNRNA